MLEMQLFESLVVLLQYLRLSDEDSADDVLKLMTEHWQLAEPKLVVSIVGGANRFDNGQFSKNRIQTLFKQGLPEIAMATGKSFKNFIGMSVFMHSPMAYVYVSLILSTEMPRYAVNLFKYNQY